MRTILIIFACSVALGFNKALIADCNTVCFSQTKYFGSTGVILNNPPDPDIIPLKKSYFSASIAEAVRADSLLLFNLPTANENRFLFNKKKLYHFDRQYVGYIKPDGSKNILVHLIKHSSAKKYIRNYDKALKCDIIIIFCAECKVDIRNYTINLNTNEAEVF